MNSAPIASPAMRRRHPAQLQLVGHHHGEGELEQVVVRRAGELGPEEGREAPLPEQGELVGVRVRRGRAGCDGGVGGCRHSKRPGGLLQAVTAAAPGLCRSVCAAHGLQRVQHRQRRQCRRQVLEAVAGHQVVRRLVDGVVATARTAWPARRRRSPSPAAGRCAPCAGRASASTSTSSMPPNWTSAQGSTLPVSWQTATASKPGAEHEPGRRPAGARAHPLADGAARSARRRPPPSRRGRPPAAGRRAAGGRRPSRRP